MPVEYLTENSGANSTRITACIEISREKTKAGSQIKLPKDKIPRKKKKSLRDTADLVP